MLFMYPYFIPQTTTQTRIRCYLMFSLYIAKRGTEGPSGLPKDTQLRGSVDWHSCMLVSQLILRTQTNQKQCLLCTDVILFWVIASFYFTCPGRWQSEKKKTDFWRESNHHFIPNLTLHPLPQCLWVNPSSEMPVLWDPEQPRGKHWLRVCATQAWEMQTPPSSVTFLWWAGEMTRVGNCWLCKHEDMSSSPGLTFSQKKKKNQAWRCLLVILRLERKRKVHLWSSRQPV